MFSPTSLNEGTKKSSSLPSIVSSWIIVLGIAGLLFVLASPLFISEAIGGWTPQYSSPVYFTPSRSIPNLSGKVALVTGANTGIGYETALKLARNGAHVIVAARSAQKGQAAIERIEKELNVQTAHRPKLDFLKLDLSSLAAVEESAKEFLKWNLPLRMLILNAGVMKSPGAEFIGKPMKYGFEVTQDGLEYHIGVNHVAHFYLTQLLQQKLQDSAPSRVVVGN
jgi:short chain dehydrogenase